jgi:putative transposase
VKNV